jgi:aminoglycoside 6'-N-acetyltransferase
MRRADLPLLLGWLRQPHVVQWWPAEPSDLDAVEAKYGPCLDGDDPTELFIIEADARPVGMIQRYLFADEPEWSRALSAVTEVDDAAGIDYLIGDQYAIGRGLGTAAIEAFVAMAFDWRPVDSIVVTVDVDNVASWRALERAGFLRIWTGEIDSPDPSDQGPQHVYRLSRPE